MAESENPPMGGAAGDAPVESTTVESLAPVETWTQEGATTSVEPAPLEKTPFRDDERLFHDGALIRDELADAQSEPDAARSLAARHWSRLLYDPNAPWRGREPYPQVSIPKPDKQGR
jgi:hypothetical protein